MIITRSLTIAGTALLCVAAFAQSGPPISVVVDGNAIQFPDQQPAMSDGRVLVPLRGVFEKLGASVDWNPANQSITARKRDIRVRLAIGQLDASVDNKPVHMDVPATLVGGTTMVPLRFVSEALGAYVTWNAPQHEVDIRSSTDYNIPHRDHDHDRDRQAPPPVIRPVPPAVIRRDDHRPAFGIIAPDTVLPFTLNTRLSSRNAQRGDAFTATLTTDRTRHYFDLPAGTIAYGAVSYVRHKTGRDPGVIELTFDHLVLPNGKGLPVVGKLVGLDDASVRRLPNGTIVAKSTERSDRMVYSGVGNGVGLVIGLKGQHAVADIEIGNLLNGALNRQAPNQRTHDVELQPGTPLGLRLYQNLMVPR